jgi:CheY-like chemotaxis protein
MTKLTRNRITTGPDLTRRGKPQPDVDILVVEDDSSVATVLESRLASFGYRICGMARSGSEAIDSAFRNDPDLILMDILLEGEMNGIEAAHEIGSRSDVPIIFLSCLSEGEVIDSAIRTNPYGYMVKPYDYNELRSAIEIALVRHRASRERERLIQRLENALLEVKKLSGLLPICASCKKIRDDQGGWHQIETYISAHSEAHFTHGLCPHCLSEHYPQLYDGNGRLRE